MKRKLTIKRNPSKKIKKTPVKGEKYFMNLPMYCDYYCKYADFSESDLSGACRRESAIYCKLFEKYNNKHNKCFADDKRKVRK